MSQRVSQVVCDMGGRAISVMALVFLALAWPAEAATMGIPVHASTQGALVSTAADSPHLGTAGHSGSPPQAPPLVGRAEAGATRGQLALSGTIDWAKSQVPADPVGLLTNQVVRPVQDRAGDALRDTNVGLGDEPAAQQDAPQAVATVATAAPTLLTGTLLLAGAAAAGSISVFLWMAGSSGSASAGAVGGRDLRRLLPFASPMFTRFERGSVLGHPKREALYALIMQNPGVSLQALGDATGLSRTAANHHLRLLELQHLVVSKRMGRSRHYYENGGRYQTHQKDAYALLQNPRSKEIASFIQDHPGSIQRDLCVALGLQASIAHWHVSRLVDADMVLAVRRGRTVTYFPGQALQAVAAPVAAQAHAVAA
ncbi:MAG: winged helix-turn-helix transcriptional regulator [Thermoplasmatota archaeon]